MRVCPLMASANLMVRRVHESGRLVKDFFSKSLFSFRPLFAPAGHL
jgi:hypothetical protein